MKWPSKEDKLTDLKCVAIDLETTGLHPQNSDRIVQISGVKFLAKSKEGIGIYDEYVNPDRFIPYSSWRVHKIDLTSLKDCPKIHNVLPSFIEFIENLPLIGHSIDFDISFINTALEKNNKAVISNLKIDTLKIAKLIFPALDSYKLGSIAEYLDLNSDLKLHNALNDSIVAKNIFIESLPSLKTRGIVTVEDAIFAKIMD